MARRTETYMAALTCQSPAKLNLFLHVTGRRADGYHTLQTLFQLIDLHDSLHFSTDQLPQGVLSLQCDDPRVPLDNNLVLRAATLLRAAIGHPELAVDIRLEKRIPMGAGLGGGSSNAALTLLALNELWQAGMSRQELAHLGLRLGADVPLFVMGRSAWATGVGEILEPVALPIRFYVILWPGTGISTAEIFSREELTRNTPAIKIADFLAGAGRNDCEPVVRRLYPAVDAALNWLGRFGTARLTGTGSCVFAGFQTQAEAERVLAEVPAAFKGFLARGLDQLPDCQRT